MNIEQMVEIIETYKWLDLNIERAVIKINENLAKELLEDNKKVGLELKPPYKFCGVEVLIDNFIPNGEFIYTHKEVK